MIRTACLTLLVPALFALPGAVVTADPASATPCDTSNHKNVWQNGVQILKRVNSADSSWNRTKDPIHEEITFGRSQTEEVEKHWEGGGGGGFNFGVVEADVEAKFGRSYTTKATTNAQRTRKYMIRAKHTGWVQAIFYQRNVFWQAYTYRWDAQKQRCVKRQLRKAFWGAPKVQYAFITKKGHVYPK